MHHAPPVSRILNESGALNPANKGKSSKMLLLLSQLFQILVVSTFWHEQAKNEKPMKV